MIIKLKDYERIFQIIAAVVESEEGNPAHSCIYFSLFAANILSDHFKLDAKVRCGLAVYHLGDDDEVLCFGEASDNGISGTEDGFHCWVQVDDWLLDFMAPTFRDLLRTDFTSRPKMFQKKLKDMAEHPNSMKKAGDFYFRHEQKVADTVLLPVCERLGVQDLAGLCSQWFAKSPKKIPPSAASMDQHGQTRPIRLKSVSLKSNW